MDPERTKKRLQKKLNQRKGIKHEPEPEEKDFMTMMNEVNKMFKSNPSMINKVSKCVDKIMDNKELMNTLKVNFGQTDQTLLNNNLSEHLTAISNESKQ